MDQELGLIHPNDFSHFEDYHMQKALVGAYASLRRYETGLCPTSVVKFIIQLLEMNSNEGNEYDDAEYKGSLLVSLAKSQTFGSPSDRTKHGTLPRAVSAPVVGNTILRFSTPAHSLSGCVVSPQGLCVTDFLGPPLCHR